jgi:hypothetical protein
MRDDDPYVMLISSLPSSEALFRVKQPPLSKIRLDQRLKMLSDEDLQLLKLVESTLKWDELSITTSEQEIIEYGRKTINQINNESLISLIEERLELRTIVAALRLKHRKVSPPSPREWGISRWTKHIIQNWAEPDFRLSGAYPWISEAKKFIDDEDPLGFERFILIQAYRSLRRHGQRHTFNLEAVVIYVLKWDVFDRWARNNAEEALQRFDSLTSSGLGIHENLKFEVNINA